jgi:hypothetical protein
MSEQQSSAVSAPSDLRAALQDIAESEPIPTFAEAWKWCKEIAQAALTCPEPQASADSEPIAWATPIADGTHQLTRHEEVAGRWRDCNLKVIELYARPQPERTEPQTARSEREAKRFERTGLHVEEAQTLDELDPGAAFIIHNVDDTVTIQVRSPGDRAFSEVEMPLDAWTKLRCVGVPAHSQAESAAREYLTLTRPVCTCGGDPDQPAAQHDLTCPATLTSHQRSQGE